jgi:hypothetical protein
VLDDTDNELDLAECEGVVNRHRRPLTSPALLKQIKAIRSNTQMHSFDVLLKKSKSWKPIEYFKKLDIITAFFHALHDSTSKIRWIKDDDEYNDDEEDHDADEEEEEGYFDDEDQDEAPELFFEFEGDEDQDEEPQDENEDEEDVEDEGEDESDTETETTLSLDNLIDNIGKHVDDRLKQRAVQQLAEKAKNYIDGYNLARRCAKMKTGAAFTDLVDSYIKHNKTEIIKMTTGAFINDSKARRSEQVAKWLVKNVDNIK